MWVLPCCGHILAATPCKKRHALGGGAPQPRANPFAAFVGGRLQVGCNAQPQAAPMSTSAWCLLPLKRGRSSPPPIASNGLPCPALQVKLFNAPLACPTSGCESVLTSSYSELFGIPLSAFGMLAYGGVGLLAVTCAAQARAGVAQESRRPSAVALAGGVAVLTSCSAFLV